MGGYCGNRSPITGDCIIGCLPHPACRRGVEALTRDMLRLLARDYAEPVNVALRQKAGAAQQDPEPPPRHGDDGGVEGESGTGAAP